MDRYYWRILLIDDDEDDYIFVREMLAEAQQSKFILEWEPSFVEGLKKLKEEIFDAILVDYDLGPHKGTELIQKAGEEGYPAPILLLTGRGSYEVDVEAMEAGALDYLNKGEINASYLERAIRYAIERKKTEEDLRASKQHLDDILASIRDGFLTWTGTGALPISTNAPRSNFNFQADQLIGQKIWKKLPQYTGSGFETAYRKVMDTRVPEQIEIESLDHDMWYFSRINPSENGITVYWQDITDRKRAEIDLQDSEARLRVSERFLKESNDRFRVALSSASIIVFSTDRDLRYNWFYSSDIGSIQQEFIGKRDDELLLAENVAEFMDLKRRALTQRTALREEINLQIFETSRKFLVSVEPTFGANGEPGGVIGACYDITELRILELEKMENTTQMEVQRRLLEYREKERQEIARDLHDGPVQDLSGLIFSIQYTKETVHDPRLQVELEQTLLGLKGAVRDLRAMINDLRPPSLIRFGLAKALQFYLEDFREKHPEILLETDLMEDGSCLSEPERLSLFRIVQESLTNAAKHASATHMKVCLTCDVDRTVLNIYDNGKGFEISNNLVDYTLKGHFGLVGMKERAEAIGGTFNILTAPGEGTSIQVSVMVPEEEIP